MNNPTRIVPDILQPQETVRMYVYIPLYALLLAAVAMKWDAISALLF